MTNCAKNAGLVGGRRKSSKNKRRVSKNRGKTNIKRGKRKNKNRR